MLKLYQFSLVLGLLMMSAINLSFALESKSVIQKISKKSRAMRCNLLRLKPYTESQSSQSIYSISPPLQNQGSSEILQNLFLGSMIDAHNVEELKKNGIKRIVNLAEENQDCPLIPEIQYLNIPLRDHVDEEISKHFEEINTFIHTGLEKREGVLVHCRRGISRSATAVMAYLIQSGQVAQGVSAKETVDNALLFVRKKRPYVSPNLGFILDIEAWVTAF